MSSVESSHTQSAYRSCDSGAMCVSIESGHGLSALRDRLSRATPSAWRDGVVTAIGPERIDVAFLDGEAAVLWNHAGFDGLVAGAPVAAHLVYGVLASGDVRWSVRAA